MACLYSPQNGMVFGPLAICPSLIFSGYFVYMKDAPSYFGWLFHVSYMKYSLEAIATAVYSYDRPKMTCEEIYCHFTSPSRFLKEVGMADVDFWTNFFVLLGAFVLLRVVGYCVLLVQVYYRRTFAGR